MKKFLVTYLAPASVIAEWKKTDPDTSGSRGFMYYGLLRVENRARAHTAVIASSDRLTRALYGVGWSDRLGPSRKNASSESLSGVARRRRDVRHRI
jgi:hypothetical protein